MTTEEMMHIASMASLEDATRFLDASKTDTDEKGTKGTMRKTSQPQQTQDTEENNKSHPNHPKKFIKATMKLDNKKKANSSKTAETVATSKPDMMKKNWREEIHDTETNPDKIKVDVTFSFYVSRAYSNARRYDVDHIPNVVKTFNTDKKFHKQPSFYQQIWSYNAVQILENQPAFQKLIKAGIIVSLKYKYFYETINDQGEIVNFKL